MGLPGKKENSLILITNHFPFGKAESFLETEINFLTKSFSSVIVLARNVESQEIRNADGNFKYHRLNPKSNIGELLMTSWNCLSHFGQFMNCVSEELGFLKKQKRKITFPIFRKLLHDLFKGFTTSYHIKRLIRLHQLQGTVTLYSYWLNTSAVGVALTKSKNVTLKKISRAHGSDIYQELHPSNYLSLRCSLLKRLDSVFTISNYGTSYLKSMGLAFGDKIKVSKLGTLNMGSAPQKKSGDPFVLISCSFISPLKRIHMIIESLALISDTYPVRWIHIGDGDSRKDLEQLAAEKLSSKKNIEHRFMGSLKNQELLNFYSKNFVDLFISASSSEGIPVSMMEAQSFGIPIITSHVGGTGEIVSNENGRLFPADATPEKIASVIEEILRMPGENYQHLRENAFKNWQTQYNAERNYSTFVAEILRL